MSELFDKLVESAGQVVSKVDEGGQIHSAISGLRARLAEADRKRKVTQIKQAIGDLQAREAQAINALSAQVLALYEAGSLSQPELLSLCRGVDEIRAQIKERQAELEQLQPAVQPASRQPTSVPGEAVAPGRARCSQCGALLAEGAAYCQSCGAAQVAPSAAYCAHCGAQLRENAKFCPTCGERVSV